MRFTTDNYALDLSKNPISQGIVVDQKVISQSIENILMTSYRERVFQPMYGSFLPTYVFNNLNAQTADSVLSSVIELIKKYEDRVSVIDSHCRIILNKPAGYLELNIVYVNIATGTAGTFNKRIVF
jgi:phage baseplate assembly protein W